MVPLDQKRLVPVRSIAAGVLGVVLVAAAGLKSACRGAGSAAPLITGTAMGTTYHIRVLPSASGQIRRRIVRELERLEDIFSTFRPGSTISRFNSFRGTGSYPVPQEMVEVLGVALHLARLSGGAYDPTLAPVINIWGFGWLGRQRAMPSKDMVQRALQTTGYEKVQIFNRRLVKSDPRVQLDLSSVAKGYAVDRAWQILRSAGMSNFVVEIGGEVRVSGSNNGHPWRVGIEAPHPDSLPGAEVLCAIELSDDQAVATSGSYRNFVALPDGRRYAHVIDGRTGYPVSNNVVAVSVVTRQCVVADGLATALMILGPERGQELLEAFPDTEALFVTHNGVNFHLRPTPGFTRYFAGSMTIGAQ